MNSIRKRKIVKIYRKAIKETICPGLVLIALGLGLMWLAFGRFDNSLKYRECYIWKTRTDCPIRPDGLSGGDN